MSCSKKYLKAALALMLGLAEATHGYSQEPAPQPSANQSQQDQQAIINNLLSQLNQLQSQQNPAPAPPTAPVTTPTATPTTVPATPVAPVNNVPASVPSAVPSTPVMPVTQTIQGVALTIESLPTFAQNLGYEVKKVNDNLYSIDASRDNFTLIVNVWCDKAQNKVWLFAYLREIPDLTKAPADSLLKLLEANNRIGPTHFYLAKNFLYAGRAFENGVITPARFRQEVDQFFCDVQKTEDLWLVDKWSTPATTQLSSTTTPVPAPAP